MLRLQIWATIPSSTFKNADDFLSYLITLHRASSIMLKRRVENGRSFPDHDFWGKQSFFIKYGFNFNAIDELEESPSTSSLLSV